MASCAVLSSATYSASAIDGATQVCFLLLQLMAAPLSVKGYPEVHLRSSRSPFQSASEKVIDPSSCREDLVQCPLEIMHEAFYCKPMLFCWFSTVFSNTAHCVSDIRSSGS